uniref:Uncharacterized protein n=1 Tax=Anguilla anguilla TaxID=7936 RepID=A0A0E9R9L4_ANGAN
MPSLQFFIFQRTASGKLSDVNSTAHK